MNNMSDAAVNMKPEIDKKQSFVNFLLEKYSSDVMAKAPSAPAGAGHLPTDEALARLTDELHTLDSKIAGLTTGAVVRMQQEMRKVSDDLVAVQNVMQQVVLPSISSSLAKEPVSAAPCAPSSGATVQRVMAEPDVAVLSRYERANLELKRANMRLMRMYYDVRIRERLVAPDAHVVSVAGNNGDAAKDGRTDAAAGLLIQRIKELEDKKMELMRDNIQINECSIEILAENKRLRDELRKSRDIA